MKKFITFIIIFIVFGAAKAQRITTDLCNDWQFKKPGDSFQLINLPHSFNTKDAFNDTPGYYRGEAIYQKVLSTGTWDRTNRHFVKFYGVNQLAVVKINGETISSHNGGYTAFVVEITDALTYSNDTLTVIVNNKHDLSIPPLMGDFTFYGGIYRKVEHISVSQIHFDLDVYGADGVFIDPVKVSDRLAELRIRIFPKHFEETKHSIYLDVTDPSGRNVAETDKFVWKQELSCWTGFVILSEPVLWSDKSPERYNFKFELVEKVTGERLDELSFPYGIRYFRFDAKEGFFLNGEHCKLVGVNRHQDRPNIGNALTEDQHIQDMDLIREMGANFLRTAHYPQDPVITDYCDRNGILVSMEIPLDHQISEDPKFNKNCKTMMLEMIHQYYNHPSVIIWAYMNEMGLRMDPVKDSLEMTRVAALAQELEDLTRKTDPYRYTMIPNHGYFDIYEKFGFFDIPMIVGWNLYFGWYVPDFDGFGKFLDMAHEKVPDKPIIVTEYGAGADPRISSFDPVRFDFSVNWSVDFHESHLKQILERDFVAGSAVWNMFDFGSEKRKDAVPHINNKGLCGYDRIPKAPYYVYQAHLRPDLYVYVPYPGPEYVLRDEGTEIDLPEAFEGLIYTPELFWNRYSVLNINFGTDFYFEEDGMNWLPDAEIPLSMYEQVEGQRGVVRGQGIGTDRAIALTERDPVYQTWIEELDALSFDLPEGHYRLIFHFSNNANEKHEGLKVRFAGKDIFKTGVLDAFRAYRFETEQWITDDLTIFIDAVGEQKSFINGLQIIRL